METKKDVLAANKRRVRADDEWRYLPDGNSGFLKSVRETKAIHKETTIEPKISLLAKAKREGVDIDSGIASLSNTSTAVDLQGPGNSQTNGENVNRKQSLQSPVDRKQKPFSRIISDEKLGPISKFIMRQKLSEEQVINLTEDELKMLRSEDYVKYAALKLIIKFLQEMRDSKSEAVPQASATEMYFDKEAIEFEILWLEDEIRKLTIHDCDDSKNYFGDDEFNDTTINY